MGETYEISPCISVNFFSDFYNFLWRKRRSYAIILKVCMACDEVGGCYHGDTPDPVD